MCHPQKKPRTRNNEILSSYSSSKFLLTPGQKRPYPSGNFFNIKYLKITTLYLNNSKYSNI